MKKFEYKIKLFPIQSETTFVKKLNKLGGDGWELVYREEINDVMGDNIKCLFKRELKKEPIITL